ncbi:PAS domain-containing protein [Pelagibius litoralis]|uniref:PAS domain-containing protein n=1 Tax=Pelagibius litoralis TaxID=374515 RepID=A0A967EV46_9PROT|nr:PAS domain-containing protein [Pelagibius litoralis]NIA68136.1 PAS domain-containing protein [Pelagibius litoralis]
MENASVQSTADQIAKYLTEGDRLDAAACLDIEINGLKLVLDPAEADLPTDRQKLVLRYWQALPKVRDIPNQVKVEPEALLPALGYLMLVDVIEQPSGFRYSLYGSKIASIAGFDMTGKTVRDIATVNAIQLFFAACYRAVIILRRPLFTVHEAPPSITVSHWNRLILPLGRKGEIERFLVCNVPLHNGVVAV